MAVLFLLMRGGVNLEYAAAQRGNFRNSENRPYLINQADCTRANGRSRFHSAYTPSHCEGFNGAMRRRIMITQQPRRREFNEVEK